MKELDYPFDSEYIIRNKRKIKRSLLERPNLMEKRIAILGGSTTDDIKNMLELFLLNYGIKPVFYESEYNMYYEDALFGNSELDGFKPDIIFIHTTFRNLINTPSITDTQEEVEEKLNNEFNRFIAIWESLANKFSSVIIQNNFEWPHYRLMGNKDVSNFHGLTNFITRINMLFYDYAEKHDNFYINDINYVSSCYGLDRWHNLFYWYMYKYAMDVNAIPYLSFNLAHIIKSIYGKNKKALVLDLDNTLWGGVIGDDGKEGIHVGPELSSGQVYYEFQDYLKKNKELGILLNINSKNDYENAIDGLNSPGCLLKPDDFIIIKANWENKNKNIIDISEELNIGADSFVFVDDNPVERDIVSTFVDGIAVPSLSNPEDYIKVIDRNGYFEVTNFSKEDLKKSELYKDNAKRSALMATFESYDDYLLSLKMTSEIMSFKDIYLERISQLSNKSNQFNLTTKRYSISDIESIKNDDNYIKLYGTLKDIFGDNGLISVVIGEKRLDELHIDLWIMSCRVLKRNMEYAMMDEVVKLSKEKEITKIYGYYYPTLKNKMVENFYDGFGFDLVNEDEQGNKTYILDVNNYEFRNNVIEVNSNE